MGLGDRLLCGGGSRIGGLYADKWMWVGGSVDRYRYNSPYRRVRAIAF